MNERRISDGACSYQASSAQPKMTKVNFNFNRVSSAHVTPCRKRFHFLCHRQLKSKNWRGREKNEPWNFHGYLHFRRLPKPRPRRADADRAITSQTCSDFIAAVI